MHFPRVLICSVRAARSAMGKRMASGSAPRPHPTASSQAPRRRSPGRPLPRWPRSPAHSAPSNHLRARAFCGDGPQPWVFSGVAKVRRSRSPPSRRPRLPAALLRRLRVPEAASCGSPSRALARLTGTPSSAVPRPNQLRPPSSTCASGRCVYMPAFRYCGTGVLSLHGQRRMPCANTISHAARFSDPDNSSRCLLRYRV